MVTYKEHNYEYYCSSQFFTEKQAGNGHLFFERAEQGYKQALEIFDEFGYHIGQAMTMILFIIDPEIIIIGGSISKSYKYFKSEMWKVLENFPYKSTRNNLKIEVTDSPKIAILGAGALYYDAHYTADAKT